MKDVKVICNGVSHFDSLTYARQFARARQTSPELTELEFATGVKVEHKESKTMVTLTMVPPDTGETTSEEEPDDDNPENNAGWSGDTFEGEAEDD